VRRWKDCYFLVRPKSSLALDNILKPNRAPRADGTVPARTSYFPLEWSDDHNKFKPGDYCYFVERLVTEEREAYDKLCAYVKAFFPIKSLDAGGNEVQMARVIDTHGLMIEEKSMDLLGSVFVSFFPCLVACLFLSCVFNILSILCVHRKNEGFPGVREQDKREAEEEEECPTC